MARPVGFEPTTLGLEGRCSILMSYGRMELCLRIPWQANIATLYPLAILVGVEGFEPPTFCSQSRRATRLRYTPRNG
jgi:hypothetical protein